ncbi:hypothetical protein F4780DRAFT_12564 [Xylariomycetidae sp. FL0641]|nr:hypothetical protein F4780DRAFT_12564 [Xylariomycetidae sp. FL0641]
MTKMPVEETFTWLLQEVRFGVLATSIWNIVRGLAFLFKLASLAFAIPIAALIAFDFIYWLYRLCRGQPAEPSQQSSRVLTSKLSEASVLPVGALGGTTSSADVLNEATASHRRTGNMPPADTR